MILDQELLSTGNLELIANQVMEGFITGMHKSPFHGFSVEFAEHRQYNSGESTRHIDWKLFGRTEKVFVKKYQEETNLRCLILLDKSSSMYYPTKGLSKLGFSVIAAATLLKMLSKQRDAASLAFFSDQIDFQSETKSTPSHFRMLMNKLSELRQSQKPEGSSKVVNVLHEIAEKQHRRSLIIIFSDMFDQSESSDELFQALQHLKYNKHEVVLFHTLLESTELNFEFENRPYLFEDLESGEKLKLFPSEVKDHYLLKMEEFYRELKFRCAQYHIDFIEAGIEKGFDQIMLPFLIKRQRMRG